MTHFCISRCANKSLAAHRRSVGRSAALLRSTSLPGTIVWINGVRWKSRQGHGHGKSRHGHGHRESRQGHRRERRESDGRCRRWGVHILTGLLLCNVRRRPAPHVQIAAGSLAAFQSVAAFWRLSRLFSFDEQDTTLVWNRCKHAK